MGFPNDRPPPGLCWAKLHRDCRKGLGDRCREHCSCRVLSVLSLIGHSADVAAVMLALLERPVVARRLGRLMSKPELSAADRCHLAALAALHDVGKISQGFRWAPFAVGHGLPGHVGSFRAFLRNEEGYSERVERLWRRYEEAGGLGELEALLGGEEEWLPLEAVLAHHGSLPKDRPADPALWQAAGGYDPLKACRELVEAIHGWLPAAFDGAGVAWTPRLGHAFAGLLTLADWLGSDTEEFPFGDTMPDGTERFAWALPRARRRLERLWLAPERMRAAVAALSWNIAALTGHPTASAAQAAMLALADAPAEGRVCLIEDETGSGKTEAAVIHFLRLFAAGAVDGMYFALPTRAAAVQIHGRIQRLLRDLLGPEAAPPVVLAVPGYLDRAAEATAPLPDEAALWDGQERAAQWAGERSKRYLAACIAVGTIDQALMGGLRMRHAELRSGALLRLLLVVDEVHAADLYMTVLLRHVLDQHLNAGGYALLMSATLGSAARDWLLDPAGPEVRQAAPTEAVAAPYPAVWTTQGTLVAGADPVQRPQKRVEILLEPDWANPAGVMERAVAAARQGARVLVIRNTVGDVVATQLALEAVAPDLSLAVEGPHGKVRAPHHGRYAPEDRRRLDAVLEAVLGAKVPRPWVPQTGGSVTIASQTAEQSLDIDADLLITDLCPADVLLQRLGRLHRRRERVALAGFEGACAIVLAPSEAELEAAITGTGEVHHAPLALGLVYPDLLGVVATRRALAASPVLSIPADNRRLVEGATHPELLDRLAAELGGRWQKHAELCTGVRLAHAQQAQGARLAWGEPIRPNPDRLEGLERIATRLGLTDRTVELAEGTVGPFGGAISKLTIPGRWLGGVAQEAEPAIEPAAEGELQICFEGKTLLYDRLGLRVAQPGNTARAP